MSNTTLVKHTPLPWKQDDLFSGVFGYEVTDNNGNTIADCLKRSFYSKNENAREIAQANAAKIVTCVNNHDILLSALKDAVKVIKQWHSADDVWDIYFNHAPEMQSIKTALQQANEC